MRPRIWPVLVGTGSVGTHDSPLPLLLLLFSTLRLPLWTPTPNFVLPSHSTSFQRRMGLINSFTLWICISKVGEKRTLSAINKYLTVKFQACLGKVIGGSVFLRDSYHSMKAKAHSGSAWGLSNFVWPFPMSQLPLLPFSLTLPDLLEVECVHLTSVASCHTHVNQTKQIHCRLHSPS